MTPSRLSTPLAHHVATFADIRQLYDFHERAAIHEFDGKADCDSAEQMAYRATFALDVPAEFLTGGKAC